MTSYKSKIYTVLGTPTNIEGNVVSVNNSSGVPAKDYTVKGKTIVWNQLLDKSKFSETTTTRGVTFTNNGDGSITVNGTADTTANAGFNVEKNISVIQGHKYYATMSKPIEHNNFWLGLYTASGDQPFQGATILERNGRILDCTVSSDEVSCTITLYKNKSVSNAVVKPQLFDLTQMFGAGNEPATTEEFRAMFPDDYYTYNAGELKTIVPTSVEAKNQSGETRSANIPSSKYFPDGMRSAGSAYDEINFLSQKAIKRIGAVDMGTLDWKYEGAASYERLVASLDGIKTTSSSSKKGNLVCPKYTTASVDDVYSHTADKIIAVHYTREQVWVYDTAYTNASAFKAAMSGVMLYYELATPVETAITPPIQALTTYKGFTSFSAANSLMQNGPLSVTYYVEGGSNPESGWLTSYKKKLYMEKNIEWNQLLDKSTYPDTTTIKGIAFTNNGDGTITANGTATGEANFILSSSYLSSGTHKYLLSGCPSGGTTTTYFMSGISGRDYGTGAILSGTGTASNIVCTIANGAMASNIIFKPQLFDLTQMFGEGNEPTTPEDFWSYFDHKLYPYNAGETQLLFKISRRRLIK